MKTATVTWISYNNYGTLLQAYALQRKIEQLGFENEILSDKAILKSFRISKQIQDNDKATDKQITGKSNYQRVVRFIKHPRKLYRSILFRVNPLRFSSPYEESQKLCDEFRCTQLKVNVDVSSNGLQELNKKYDLFVAGSDQIWSVFESIFNPFYYLDFATKKKVAYAPSLGTNLISEKLEKEIIELLSDYSAISVREQISAEHLRKITGKEVHCTADPTLLFDRSFWEKFSEDSFLIEKKYLLCHFLEDKKWYFDYARSVARRLHLQIVVLPNKWNFLNCEYIIKHGVGPKEFVSLFQHAEYVLTDSYHGSIFSLIFERNFRYLQRFSPDDPMSQNIRIQSLFDYLDINDIIISKGSLADDSTKLDYELIRKRLNLFREHSVRYLSDSLNVKEKS